MGRKQKPVTWKDKSGAVVDEARIMKHDKSVSGMIKKIFPAWECVEASMNKYDLISECRIEVAKALENFDPTIAIEGVTKFADRKTKSDEEHIEWKRANVEKALEKAEALWVRKRLLNYLRRLRYNNSFAEKQGKTVSFSAILATAEANNVLNMDWTSRQLFAVEESETPDYHHGATLFLEEHSFKGACLDVEQAESDRDELIDILDKKGIESFKARLQEIQFEDQERYESLISFLDAKTRSSTTSYTFTESDENNEVTSSEFEEESDEDDYLKSGTSDF